MLFCPCVTAPTVQQSPSMQRGKHVAVHTVYCAGGNKVLGEVWGGGERMGQIEGKGGHLAVVVSDLNSKFVSLAL